MNKAVFLDRDGVLNEDCGYVASMERFKWIAGAVEAVAALHERDFLVFVVTNQSGVARGYFSEEAVRKLHEEVQSEMRLSNTYIDAFRYCPHHPDAIEPRYRTDCNCRKPKPGLLLSLIDEFEVDRAESFLIGDKVTDLIAARRAGVRGHRFSGTSLIDFVSAILAAHPPE